MRKKQIVLVAIIAGLTVTASVAFAYTKDLGPFSAEESTSETTQISSPTPDDTRIVEIEGSSVPVPNTVDPNSIKPYVLITENERYKIRKLNNMYTVTLYAIINRPDQASVYQDQLKEYKGEALEFLSKSGLDISKLDITYEPSEAKDL